MRIIRMIKGFFGIQTTDLSNSAFNLNLDSVTNRHESTGLFADRRHMAIKSIN